MLKISVGRAVWLSAVMVVLGAGSRAAEPERVGGLIGYTEFRTDLPGGRWANIATMRAHVVGVDGSGRRPVATELLDQAHVWTQFAGWSEDGQTAIVYRGWNDPENGRWEETHRTFRMEPDRWLFDSYLVDLATGRLTNVTGVDRVSHYNSGLFYLPGGQKLAFTALIAGVSKPYVMDLDGHHKQDVSGGGSGFAYGYSASPDGKMISYHENYQIYLANVDGSGKRQIETGNPFNFGPRWSPDGQWLLFSSGRHGNSYPYIVRRDGSGLRKLADTGGYQGWVLFLDVDDYHEGSSDVPAWGANGAWIYFTTKVGDRTTEIVRANVSGNVEQLTRSDPGTLNYQPIPSLDGKWICFGSTRSGRRQLYVMSAAGGNARAITDVPRGHGALWPYWQPTSESARSSPLR